MTKTWQERKALPVASGVLDYFPDALLEVARCSKVGNDQHNPGQPLHWAKHKSTDEADALLRHLIDRGKVDTDGVRHSAKVAWRALALLQREIESERAKEAAVEEKRLWFERQSEEKARNEAMGNDIAWGIDPTLNEEVDRAFERLQAPAPFITGLSYAGQRGLGVLKTR